MLVLLRFDIWGESAEILVVFSGQFPKAFRHSTFKQDELMTASWAACETMVAEIQPTECLNAAAFSLILDFTVTFVFQTQQAFLREIVKNVMKLILHTLQYTD